MIHPFAELQPEYDHLLSAMRVTRPVPVEEGCQRIIRRGLDVYRGLAAAVNVPALLLAALDLREGDCDPMTGIGQGDRWDRVSTHVPRGKGPFSSWLEANKFYVAYDHLDSRNGLVPTDPFTWAFACYKSNAWNGFGPNAHGHYSGYVFSCTNVYDDPPSPPARGKYRFDGGGWDPNYLDPQPGTIPVMIELAKAYPDLAFAPLPMVTDAAPRPPAPLPVGLGGDEFNVKEIQDGLNRLLALDPPLLLDGSFGRMTRNAIRSFQRAHGLQVDGIAGPVTIGALAAALHQ
jgi:peptidoglycan hydrolase-like protein with peptidoglycan-binding domain